VYVVIVETESAGETADRRDRTLEPEPKSTRTAKAQKTRTRNQNQTPETPTRRRGAGTRACLTNIEDNQIVSTGTRACGEMRQSRVSYKTRPDQIEILLFQKLKTVPFVQTRTEPEPEPEIRIAQGTRALSIVPREDPPNHEEARVLRDGIVQKKIVLQITQGTRALPMESSQRR